MAKHWGLSAAILAVTATAAEAHTGVGVAHGVAAGLAHPMVGLDHLLAMVAVGLLAARIGGRALWLVPAAFLVMMAAGGALGVYGVALPFVETMIALSVVAIAGAVALGVKPGAMAAAFLVGGFALFHGHAHGAEMPLDVSGYAYAAGFLAATAALHAAGVALGRLPAAAVPATRVAAGIVAAVGVGMLAGIA